MRADSWRYWQIKHVLRCWLRWCVRCWFVFLNIKLDGAGGCLIGCSHRKGMTPDEPTKPTEENQTTMQAILTRYIAPTNTRGSFISAECERGSFKIPAGMLTVDCASEAAHRLAVDALCAKFAKEDAKAYGAPVDKNPWLRAKVAGGMPQKSKHAFCFVFSAGPDVRTFLTELAAEKAKDTQAARVYLDRHLEAMLAAV